MKYFFGWCFFIVLLSCHGADNTVPNEMNPAPKDSAKLKKVSSNPFEDVDISPMDMSYLPSDYPKMSVRRPLPVARVIYSRPHKQGRKIFGSLLKYGEPWRLGANEATEIEFFIPVTIQGKSIRAGKYILYCIPEPDQWTIVFNSNLNSWGLTFDSRKDLYKFPIPVLQNKLTVEYFSLMFQTTSGGADMLMAWDNMEARLPIQFKEK